MEGSCTAEDSAGAADTAAVREAGHLSRCLQCKRHELFSIQLNALTGQGGRAAKGVRILALLHMLDNTAPRPHTALRT
jgi:hypothetical protein